MIITIIVIRNWYLAIVIIIIIIITSNRIINTIEPIIAPVVTINDESVHKIKQQVSDNKGCLLWVSILVELTVIKEI